MSHLYHLKHTHHIKVPSLHHAATQQHAHNRTGAAWGKANCLCLTRGQLDDDNIFMKSVVTQQYLLGYELPDTVILLNLDGNCTVLATKKKCDFFRVAVGKAPPGSKILDLNILERCKEDKNEANFATLIEQVKLNKDGDKVNIGCFAKEWDGNSEPKGTIVAGWQQKIEETEEFEKVDITPGIGLVMALKDQTELDLMKKSSVLSNKVLKQGFVPT